jgi:predicted ATP-binding protein involved in virulence
MNEILAIKLQITGPRASGKSSLLREIELLLKEADFLTTRIEPSETTEGLRIESREQRTIRQCKKTIITAVETLKKIEEKQIAWKKRLGKEKYEEQFGIAR